MNDYCMCTLLYKTLKCLKNMIEINCFLSYAFLYLLWKDNEGDLWKEPVFFRKSNKKIFLIIKNVPVTKMSSLAWNRPKIRNTRIWLVTSFLYNPSYWFKSLFIFITIGEIADISLLMIGAQTYLLSYLSKFSNSCLWLVDTKPTWWIVF